MRLGNFFWFVCYDAVAILKWWCNPTAHVVDVDKYEMVSVVPCFRLLCGRRCCWSVLRQYTGLLGFVRFHRVEYCDKHLPEDAREWLMLKALDR